MTEQNPSSQPSQTGEENAGLVALDAMKWTRLGADHVPENTEGFRAGWRIHDFPADDKWAHFICDGIEDKEYADALVEAVNFALASRSPIPGELSDMVSIYTVEEDEGRVHLSVCRQPIAVHDINSPRGIALLKLDAALRQAAINPIPGELKALSDAATAGEWLDGTDRIRDINGAPICSFDTDRTPEEDYRNARFARAAVNHVRQALAKTLAEGGEGG